MARGSWLTSASGTGGGWSAVVEVKCGHTFAHHVQTAAEPFKTMAVPGGKRIVYLIKLIPHDDLLNAPGLLPPARNGTLTVAARSITPIDEVAPMYFFGEERSVELAINAGGITYIASKFDSAIADLPHMDEHEATVLFGEAATIPTNAHVRVLTVCVNMRPKSGAVPFGLALTPPCSATPKPKGQAPKGQISSSKAGSLWAGTTAYQATNEAVHM
jgi:hypothetical protein